MSAETMIRPEVRALVKRGNVTLEEWQTFRGNSWEMEAIVQVLTNEALAHVVQHWVTNSRLPGMRPFTTYNEAVIGLLVPLLVKRLTGTDITL